MSQTDGDKLAEYLRVKGINANVLSKELNVSRQTVYHHLKQTEIDIGFKKRLAEAGHNLFKIKLTTRMPPQEDVNSAYEATIQSLRDINTALKELSVLKDEKIKALEKQISILEEKIRKHKKM